MAAIVRYHPFFTSAIIDKHQTTGKIDLQYCYWEEK